MHAKLATLEEIGRAWTLVDLVKAHTVLDIYEDLDRLVHQRESHDR